jgi:hypothetical protein
VWFFIGQALYALAVDLIGKKPCTEQNKKLENRFTMLYNHLILHIKFSVITNFIAKLQVGLKVQPAIISYSKLEVLAL